MRQSVGARELKTRLGRYLRAVRAGATVIVTERGEPVAELRPIAQASGGMDARLDALVTAGMLTKGAGGKMPRFAPVRVAGGPVSDAIADDREDRL